MLNNIDFLEDYICGNKFVDICDYKIISNDFNINKEELKKNQLVFVKTDKLQDFFNIIKELPYKYIIITHNSDYNINDERYSWKPNNIKFWFAQNVLIDKPDLMPIPIGLENINVGNSGNIEDFHSNLIIPREKNNLMYINFANETNPKRLELKNYFCNNWVTKQISRIDLKSFLEQLNMHHFVLSPPGNGSDCHRTWETFYSNSIPICENNSHNRFFAKILPILLYDNYCIIDENFLLLKLEEIKQKLNTNYYTMNALRFSFWKEIILFYKNILLK